MTKVIGIGWAKTGTTTLGACLELLGFNHQGRDLALAADLESGNYTRILKVALEKESFDDWPWISVYKHLDSVFPGSKFVLTRRDPQRWVQSYTNMLAKQGRASDGMNRLRSTLYGLTFPDVTPRQLQDRYERHNAEALAYFQDRRKDLLVVNWERGDGWGQLCAFLEKPVPDLPFPHANKGKYVKTSLLRSAVLRLRPSQ